MQAVSFYLSPATAIPQCHSSEHHQPIPTLSHYPAGEIHHTPTKSRLTTAKPVTAFRVLTMAVDLSRLTTGTMNSNAGHKKTSKVTLYINSTD